MKNKRLCYCGSGKLYEKCCLFLDEIKKECKDIKPHEGDEFHSYFLDVERYELTEAEDFFKRLIQCQPEHHITKRIWLRAFGTPPKSCFAGLQIRLERYTNPALAYL